MRDINEIILHCSATWSKQDIGAAEIKRWHTLPPPQGRGWKDIGYHFVIRRNGAIEDGRPLEQAGAHCTGHNQNSIGICMVGGGPNGEDDKFTEAQFDALARKLNGLRRQFPCTSIHGHNEFANKACPVFNVANFLKRYGIPKYPRGGWDAKRWPHFKATEFDNLYVGDMPVVWEHTLDALERLRAKYGKPLVILHNDWERGTSLLFVDVKVPADMQRTFIRLAMDTGFISARAVDGGVRVYMDANA